MTQQVYISDTNLPVMAACANKPLTMGCKCMVRCG
jgi:hypothetical protein